MTFRWCNAQNCLGVGDGKKVRPVWREGNGAWQRVVRVDARRGALASLEVAWKLIFRVGRGEVAFTYPYEPADLEAALKANPAWRRQVIGVTGAGRPLEALSLGGFPAQRGLFVVARQHCGETPGAWVLDGLLRAARAQRDFCVIAVPAVDLDGALGGDYGKDKFPQDFNRAWSNANAMRPETLAIRRLMLRWRAAGGTPLALDLHAPGACEREGPYFYVSRALPEPSAALQPFIVRAYALLPKALRGPREKFARFADYPTRWPMTLSFSDSAATELKWPAASMETPYQGNGNRYYSMADYRAIGRALWKAAVETARPAT